MVTLEGHKNIVLCVAISFDNSIIASGIIEISFI